jgi:hypothetical protein
MLFSRRVSDIVRSKRSVWNLPLNGSIEGIACPVGSTRARHRAQRSIGRDRVRRTGCRDRPQFPSGGRYEEEARSRFQRYGVIDSPLKRMSQLAARSRIIHWNEGTGRRFLVSIPAAFRRKKQQVVASTRREPIGGCLRNDQRSP